MTGPPGRTRLDGLPPVKAGPGSVPQGSAVVEDHAHLRVGRRQDKGLVLAQASDEPVLVLRHRQAHRGDAARPARVGEVRRARVDGEVRHEKGKIRVGGEEDPVAQRAALRVRAVRAELQAVVVQGADGGAELGVVALQAQPAQALGALVPAGEPSAKIGRASCRERV